MAGEGRTSESCTDYPVSALRTSVNRKENLRVGDEQCDKFGGNIVKHWVVHVNL